MWRKALRAGLIILSILATIKICILSLGIDEEYAVAMSYRIASGDLMFREMWEPHQTSGFLSAFLIRIFLLVTGGTDYLIIYLRLCGCFLQFLISILLYKSTKRHFHPDACFLAAVFFYNTLPKWIQTPEFSNMLIWFSVLAFICFLRYFFPIKVKEGINTGSFLWLIGAGVSVSCLVLSYPSCVFAVPVFLLCMWMCRAGQKPRFKTYCQQAGIFLGTCVALGGAYVLYFLRQMSIQDFYYGLSQMMTDGAHSTAFYVKLLIWGQELLGLLPHVLIAVIPAAVLSFTVSKLRALNISLVISLCIAFGEQMVIWLGNSEYLQRPLIYFYVLYIGGYWIYLYYFKNNSERHKGIHSFLFWMGVVAGGAVWLSALAITNTTVSVTGPYLMIGLISAILLISESFSNMPVELKKVGLKLEALAALFLIGTTLFAKGFLVCSNEGYKDTVGMVRQKALYGPAKGIYCRYMDGYTLNRYAELLEQASIEHKRVLYVGVHSLIYLYGEQVICNYSTISTPTFDERLKDYWERNPEKQPELVICGSSEESLEEIRQIISLGEELTEAVILEDQSQIKIFTVAEY